MRFGYGLIGCQRYPGDPRTDVELYREALGLAEEAERLGLDSVWTSEHHFADDAYAPSLLPLSAAIAARTRSIKIGTGLLMAPFYPPLRLAEDAAVVDLLSEGRFILGLGLGWLEWEFDALGVPFRDRVRLTEEAIRVCRQGWGDGLVEGPDVAVHPKPARPGGPPIWLGGHAEPAVRRAARIADGWLAGEPDLDEFRTRIRWLRDEAARSGRDPDTIDVAGYWPVFVWEDGDAWELVRPYHHYTEWKYDDLERARGRIGALPSAPPLDAATDAEIRTTMICGKPGDVTEEIGRYRKAAGRGFHFVARMYYPGMDRAVMRESTRLFAEAVVPVLRG
jgi:alkanesulfonate monooxygenase SsuD/methylene tetrahydromethanopterin reductase-like flavin-dependent oxidoreductase (luciferase family)